MIQDISVNSIITFQIEDGSFLSGKVITVLPEINSFKVKLIPTETAAIQVDTTENNLCYTVPAECIRTVFDNSGKLMTVPLVLKEFDIDSAIVHVVDTEYGIPAIDARKRKITPEEYLEQNPIFKEVFHFFNDNKDCPCILIPCDYQPRLYQGDILFKFEWNKLQYDNLWNDSTIIPFEAYLRNGVASIDIIVTKPFNRVFNIVKVSPNLDKTVLFQQCTAFINMLQSIKSAIKEKYRYFRYKSDFLRRDIEDYVDSVMTRASDDGRCGIWESSTNNKHFELTEEKKSLNNKTLYRIKATEDIPNLKIKKGDLGGFVQSTNNISSNRNSWVYDNACVYGNSIVDGGIVKDNAKVYGLTKICEGSIIKDNAEVNGDESELFNTVLSDSAKISGEINVLQDAKLTVEDNVELAGSITFTGNATISDKCKIQGKNLKVEEWLVIDDAQFQDNCNINAAGYIGGNHIFKGKCRINGTVYVHESKDKSKLVFENISSKNFEYPPQNKEIKTAFSVKKQEPGKYDYFTGTRITQSQEEVFDNSIEKDSKFNAFLIKNLKDWDDSKVIPQELFSEKQIKYLKTRKTFLLDVGDDGPVYFEVEPEEDGNIKDAVFEISDISAFYAILDKDGIKIEKLYCIPKEILK